MCDVGQTKNCAVTMALGGLTTEELEWRAFLELFVADFNERAQRSNTPLAARVDDNGKSVRLNACIRNIEVEGSLTL